MSLPVRCLSFHATYKCRHSGACCTAGWPIPVEADRLGALVSAVANGTLRAATPTTSPFVESDAAPVEAPSLLRVEEHRCVFYDVEAPSARCRIHSALGHDALPQACRQFPRVCVRDPRGVSVTLSHYCPTAFALLDDARPVTIATDPPAFPVGGEYVGLDATTSLPPLLRDGLLMDWDGWWTFEAMAVETLAARGRSAVAALSELHARVTQVQAWRPADGPLSVHVDRAFTAPAAVAIDHGTASTAVLVAETIATVPADLRASVPPPSSDAEIRDGTVRRFLAAHAFANWMAHLGGGLDGWLRSLDRARALLDAGYTVRDADLILRHLADPFA